MSRSSQHVRYSTVPRGHLNHVDLPPPASIDPLFIVGTGRCGSTLFHDLLTRHPHVSFMTRFANRYPTKPAYNRACVACIDIAGTSVLRQRYYPVEAYKFWDVHYRGFSQPFRDLTAADASPIAARRLRAATRQFTTARRPRLIFKITGWPRIGFLQAIYPNAKFISVIRDGRAAASSLLTVPFWDGWLGPNKWSWGPLDHERNERWERHDRSFVALAALQWDILMESYEQAKAHMPDPRQLLEIRYEDLCAEPLRVFRKAVEFAELDFCSRFAGSIAAARLRDANQKWREDLSPAQQSTLMDCLHEPLQHWGYESQRGSMYSGSDRTAMPPNVTAAGAPRAVSLS